MPDGLYALIFHFFPNWLLERNYGKLGEIFLEETVINSSFVSFAFTNGACFMIQTR